jgi:hypothetical protein
VSAEEEILARDGQVKELLQNLYGILEDWKAHKYGGETLAEAIDKLAAAAGTAPKPTAELKKISTTLNRLVDAASAQPPAPSDTSGQLDKIASALEQIAARAVAGDTTNEAQQKIRENFAQIATRMGPRPDTGNNAVRFLPARRSSLSARDPILPTPVFAGADASIFGVGLDDVCDVLFGDHRAAIRRRTAGELQLTVPCDVAPPTSQITVKLGSGETMTLTVDVVDVACSQGPIRDVDTQEVTA